MFFILSKILLFFILPFSWFLAFLVVALIVKKPHLKRRYLIISAAILFVFTNPLLLNIFAKHWDVKPVPLTANKYSCAIVLGGFSGETANGGGAFNGLADRFIQGLKLLSTGKVSHILITSGNGNLLASKFKEADWAKSQLRLLNVPDSLILVEDQSRNTLENAAFSKKVLAQSHLQPPYLLVTSAFHMRRALGIFNREKIPVVPYPCNYVAGNGKVTIFDFIPDPGVFNGWALYIKEVVGSVVNHFK
jgi:uncharacterized SAM-binding protein YcdF (DUF218 family)